MEWNGCDTTKNVHVSMSAIEDLALYDVEKPFELWYPAEPHLARTNCKFVDHEVSVKDARADLEVLNLDTAGFEFIYHKSQCLPDADHGEILGVETYLNETINLVCDHLKAEAIVCYDWRYRRNDPDISNDDLSNDDAGDRSRPLNVAQRIHSDDSTDGGWMQLERRLNDDELSKIKSQRWRAQFVNVWRPLVSIVEDAPLALCDRRSVKKEDCVACDKVHDDHVKEDLYIKYKPGQKWYYLSHQTQDEPVLFLTWDSDLDPDIALAGPPHASFNNPTAKAGEKVRESLEVRLIVMT